MLQNPRTGHNEAGYNEAGYNEAGYNEAGHSEAGLRLTLAEGDTGVLESLSFVKPQTYLHAREMLSFFRNRVFVCAMPFIACVFSLLHCVACCSFTQVDSASWPRGRCQSQHTFTNNVKLFCLVVAWCLYEAWLAWVGGFCVAFGL